MPAPKRPAPYHFEITTAEMITLYHNVLEGNLIRSEAGLPVLDVEDELESKASDLLDSKFDSLLRPYLDEAKEIVRDTPGLPGRIMQYIRTYKVAEALMYQETGIRRPRSVSFDLVKFLSQYETGTLHVASGAFTPKR